MKSAIFALIGSISAEQIMKAEDLVSPIDDLEELSRMRAEMKAREAAAREFTEEPITYDYAEICGNAVDEFHEQNDWYLLGPKGHISKMEVEKTGHDWGYINLKNTDWELKWWMNGTMISEHPTGKHIQTPGGDFDCDPKTGTFYITWKEEEEDKAIFMFSS